MDNSKVIDKLLMNNSLYDTKLNKIEIYKNEKGNVEVGLTFVNFRKESDFSKIKLLFTGVIEFNFYHNEDYIFYDVSNYKLLKYKKGFYISLDPDDNTDNKSDNDLDYIYSKELSLIDINKKDHD